ncbi:NAD(P)/FAD-dependent oxidoreductase [Cohaesibacter celericrescens]|uniref:FAD-dependent oxidoreductase n=1 Tax=Cohaesibacter celericrescens TaxID=2067669 RepID=A0A2N5XLN8_9HYPH|nr:FAD-dependent oxidoreductase [Cohaesibacter celericrescens]PLW75451.1 FAD-dependent oxidoreductase [Cohaesibacter celericrescens]PLW78858.1 FAD-dependent oxidoreductase [Cohaesibacter celericrescens]
MTHIDYIDSFYKHTMVPALSPLTLNGLVQVDVCIIGAGLAGLTAARELLKAGKSVVLIEGNRVGWGASGRNGGFVSDGYAQGLGALERQLGVAQTKALFDVSRLGTNYVQQAVSELGARGVRPQEGWLRVSRYSNEDRLQRDIDYFNSVYGTAYGYWPKERVREHLVSELYFQGMEDPEAFHIQPLNYALALAQDIRQRGGQIYEGQQARSLEKSSGHWTVRCEGNGHVQAGSVLLCGSAYMQDLYPKLERAVLPVATYVMTSEPMAHQLSRAIRYAGCIGDTRRAGDYYRLVEDSSRLLWGGRMTTRRSQPQALASMLKKDILSIYPQLGDFGVDFAWAGLMGYCLHKMPVLREMEPGLWSATATGGHGLNSTATIGMLAAEGIAGLSDRHRLFEPFDAQWGGGPIGRMGTQLVYWGLQMHDWWDEWRS